MKIKGQVPVVSIKALSAFHSREFRELQSESQQLLKALEEWGFVYIKDHGVPQKFLQQLESVAKEFFNLPLCKKMKIKMALGGRAWRGYFPVGDELTSGIEDAKEGIYFGTELDKGHPKVLSHTPLHGLNLWPDEDSPKLRHLVLDYITRLTQLGHALMRGLAIALELDENYFKNSHMQDPTILFRIFNYPKSEQVEGWGVGEHTDYGFLTILKTDEEHTGLQILSPDQEWIDAPPIKDTFIINIGDQLEIATKGLLKATPHRVKIQRNGDRLSFPFFLDPDWDAKLKPIELDDSKVLKEWVERGGNGTRKSGKRWDGKDLHQSYASMTYGEYLTEKVSKCFPQLFQAVV